MTCLTTKSSQTTRFAGVRYTLIEMLVVISIIAVLVAMLLPGVMAAKRKARYANWLGYSRGISADPGCVFHADFEGQDGSELNNKALLYDGVEVYKPNLLNGTIETGAWNNPTRVPGKWTFGRWAGKPALEFDGTYSSDHGNSSMLEGITDAITVMAWVNKADTSNGVVMSCGGGWNEAGFNMFWLSGNIRVELQRKNPNEKTMCDTPAPSVGEWHLIHYTWSTVDNTIRVYYDTELVKDTCTFNGPISFPQDTLCIGRQGKHGNHFKGLIDQVIVFDRVLSEDEMREFYEVGRPD
jgi:prepilin-type N-terminal cleavage/methylation domain-containing protein